MDKEQVAWASTHDWFVASMWMWGNEYKVMCRGDIHEPEYLWFDNFSQLKKWAGY